MKVTKKEHKSYYLGVDKFCCNKMKKYLGRDYIIWMSERWYKPVIVIGDRYKDYIEISYCPFCGEKIE